MNKLTDGVNIDLESWPDWATSLPPLPPLKDIWLNYYVTSNRDPWAGKPVKPVKRDNMWIVRTRDDRQWHDYFPTRGTRTHTITEQFRYEGGKGRRSGSAGFQPFRVERDEHGQYKFHAIGKPVRTLQQAKDFVGVLVRLDKS